MRKSWNASIKIRRTFYVVKPQNGSKYFQKSTFWVYLYILRKIQFKSVAYSSNVPHKLNIHKIRVFTAKHLLNRRMRLGSWKHLLKKIAKQFHDFLAQNPKIAKNSQNYCFKIIMKSQESYFIGIFHIQGLEEKILPIMNSPLENVMYICLAHWQCVVGILCHQNYQQNWLWSAYYSLEPWFIGTGKLCFSLIWQQESHHCLS